MDFGQLYRLSFPTYDGSGQVVHPDVMVFPKPWRGWRYWLALTPYPSGNAAYENPSVFASNDGITWVVPPGARNPLVDRPASGHYSDTDLLYNPDRDELWLYYREATSWGDNIYLVTSADGSSWSPPVKVLSAPGRSHIAPAVVRTPDGLWRVWYVDGIPDGCGAKTTSVRQRISSDGETWSAPAPVQLVQPGHIVWHMDVEYIPSHREYWALYAAYPIGGRCASADLFFARSSDGITWHTFGSPVLGRGEVPLFATNVYRSTFAYDPEPDVVTVWYSGAQDSVFSAAASKYRLDDFLHRLDRPAPLPQVASRTRPPPLSGNPAPEGTSAAVAAITAVQPAGSVGTH